MICTSSNWDQGLLAGRSLRNERGGGLGVRRAHPWARMPDPVVLVDLLACGPDTALNPCVEENHLHRELLPGQRAMPLHGAKKPKDAHEIEADRWWH